MRRIAGGKLLYLPGRSAQGSVGELEGWEGLRGGGKVQEGGEIHTHTHTHTLEKGMATHSSILPWRIPWTEEPARLQSIGSQRVGHD